VRQAQCQMIPLTDELTARRGERLIASHHPLRETLISQLGPERVSRNQALVRRHTAATEMIPWPWMPPVSKVGH
jgi:hypothetical protein